MSSAEWKREAVDQLIDAYREHPVLFNMRHPRYYNKSSRTEALNQILAEMRSVRPETTSQDVLRKIQTLRTQFGQEIAKSRRAAKHGMTYTPTAWWFKGLSFLQHHIKHRSLTPDKNEPDISWKRDEDDNSFNISIVQNDPSEMEMAIVEGGSNDYEHSMDGMEYQTEVHYEIEPIDNSKNVKTVELKAVPQLVHNNKQTNGTKRKCERSSVLPYQQDRSQAPLSTITSFELPTHDAPVPRHVSLGNFTAAQMARITDDHLFYTTQMQLLNVVNQAILKQLSADKNAANTGKSGGKGTNIQSDEVE